MVIKDVLPNGIRVLTEELSYIHSVSLGIWVGTGSRYEQKEINGVSHFLEHMLFKGTEKRTAKQIAESMEAVGGQLNAFTSKEYTCYYARVLSEHFSLAADLLADMFLNSLFLGREMEKEKNVILEEIKMYEDTPDELVHDLYAKTMWGNGPLGQAIIGTTESVDNLARSQLVGYYQKNYVPDNVVIAVVGNISRQQVLAKITELFSGFSGETHFKVADQSQAGSASAFLSRDIEQVHLCLGSPGISNHDERIYALYVLNSVLGGGISSRLFQEVREERGLSYSIYSYHSAYSDTGLFGVYAGTSHANAGKVVEIILKEISHIKKIGVTSEELERAKQQIKGSILLSLENVGGRMNRLGKSEITHGRVISPEEMVSLIMNVNNDAIMEVAEQIFQPEKFVLAAIGPGHLDLDIAHLVSAAGI